MNRGLTVVGLVVLVAVLVWLNRGLQQTAHSDEEQKPAQKSEQKAGSAPAPADIAPEENSGDWNRAKYKITAGWVYDEAAQASPAALAQALGALSDAVRKQGGVALEIVNLDVAPEDRSPAARAVTSLGLTVNGQTPATVGGKPVNLSGNFGTGDLTADRLRRIVPALTGAANSAPP